MGKIDKELWTPFIKLWDEAKDAGLTVHEMAQLTGINVNTLCSRQFALRRRGIMLPLLKGQRGPKGPRGKKRKVVVAAAAEPMPGVEPIVIYVM